MPFIIAAALYGFLAVLAITLVVVAGLLWGRQPGRAVLVGAVGSLVGFLIGCGVAVLVCVAALGAGSNVGVTAVVVAAGLIGAVMGSGVAVSSVRQTWLRWSPPNMQGQAGLDAEEGGV
jgi:hypothetical protein